MHELNKEITQGQPPKNGQPTARAPVGQASSLTVRAASLPPVQKTVAREQAHPNTGLGSPVNRQAGMPDPQSGQAHPSRRGRFAAHLLILACGAVFCLTAIRGAGADAPTLSETQVKALFIFNFTKYVEWPESAFASPAAPLTIGLLGGGDLAEPLRALVAGKTCNGRPIMIEDNLTAGKATNCHILFLSAAQQKDLPALLSALRGQPVLAVGENEKFTRLGGIVNFGRRDSKVRLEINTASAGEARLKISAKLLGVADVVQHKP
jgi:hypothetical protein